MMKTRAAQRRSAAPLAAWFWGVLFCLCFAIAYLYASNTVIVPPSQAFLAFNEARIDSFAARKDGGGDKLRIAMMGNSRLKYGTLLRDDNTHFIDHPDVEVLRLVNNWANFSDFAPMMDKLLAAEPDMIVLQLDMLGRGPRDWGQAIVFREYLNWRMFGQGPWNPGDADHQEIQYLMPCLEDWSDTRFAWRFETDSNWLTFSVDNESAVAAQAFVKEVAEAGIPVVLLAMPITERASATLTPMEELLSEVLDELTAHPKVTPITYPDTLKTEHFCDFVHMSHEGRTLLTPWLVDQLKRIANQRVKTAERIGE